MNNVGEGIRRYAIRSIAKRNEPKHDARWSSSSYNYATANASLDVINVGVAPKALPLRCTPWRRRVVHERVALSHADRRRSACGIANATSAPNRTDAAYRAGKTARISERCLIARERTTTSKQQGSEIGVLHSASAWCKITETDFRKPVSYHV